MACFIVPTVEAIVTTALTKAVQSKEKEQALKLGTEYAPVELATKTPFSRKLKWLSNLLWGGSALLAFEHLWHGEVIPWFPFLTATSNPTDAAAMLAEMSTAGVAMAVLITVVWGAMVLASNIIEKREMKLQPAAE